VAGSLGTESLRHRDDR